MLSDHNGSELEINNGKNWKIPKSWLNWASSWVTLRLGSGILTWAGSIIAGSATQGFVRTGLT